MSLHVKVSFTDSPDLHAALLAYAAETQRSPANLCKHAVAALLSRQHRWTSGTRGRPLARERKGIDSAVADGGAS